MVQSMFLHFDPTSHHYLSQAVPSAAGTLE